MPPAGPTEGGCPEPGIGCEGTGEGGAADLMFENVVRFPLDAESTRPLDVMCSETAGLSAK